MAFTQAEQDYIKRVLQAQKDPSKVTFQDIKGLIDQRRQKEASMNAPKEKGILKKIGEGIENIGGGVIQAGGELVVGLPGQLSRLAPGDQSVDQSSFYNKTQRFLESQKKDLGKTFDVESKTFGVGKLAGNLLTSSVGSGLLAKGVQAGTKLSAVANLGTKIAKTSPTTAKYGGAILKGFGGVAGKGNLAQRTLGGAATGLREGLGFGLASGQDTRSAMKTGAIIGGTIPIVSAGASILGKGIKKGGEALYKTAIRPNVDEAGKIIQAKAKGLAMPTTRADTALKYGVQGTEKSIGIQGVKKADKIFKETINPAIERSKVTHKIDDIFSEVEKKISETRSVTRKQELIDGLNAWKEEFSTTGKKIFNTGDLQAEKSALDKFTQSKIFKGKEVADGYNQVKNILANVMRQRVRDDLGKTGVKNAKELYKEWANLMELENIGIKGITEGGKRGGSGTAIMTILDKYLTPVKTIGGNTLYRAGKGIEFTGPKGIEILGKFLRKGGYKIVDGFITKE